MQKSTLDLSREASLMILLIGAFNWGITAVNVMAQKPIVFVPDLFSIFFSGDFLYQVQVFIYFVVALSGAFYALSFVLPRCFPALSVA